MDDEAKKEIRIAVLIDADNISHQYVNPMMQEIARYGNPTIKRIYGDWTKPNLNGWKSLLLDYAISPVQQFAYTSGKNSTDSALIIDAMDILFSGRADAFCLVSSDCDFTRIAMRLREAGKTVYGIGEQKTPNAFIAACDRFIYLEILEDNALAEEGDMGDKSSETDKATKSTRGKASGKAKTTTTASKESGKKNQIPRALNKVDRKLLLFIDQSLHDLEDEDGWVYMGELGQLLVKKQPSFDSRNYGFAKLSTLMRSIERYEVEYRDVANGSSQEQQLYCRIKNDPTRFKRNEREF